MKVGLKVLLGAGAIALALFWWFSNPARAPKGQQGSPESSRPDVQLVAQTAMPIITEFEGPNEASRWRSVDDVVMGGVSQSGFSVTPEEIGVFSGELSLENNGGFASVRRSVEDFDFGGAEAIALRVKGDGRRYQLRVQTETTNNSISYRAEFETTADDWIEVRVPIVDLEPVFRGRVVANAPELVSEEIAQIGFLLADKQPGSFRLDVDWIKIEL